MAYLGQLILAGGSFASLRDLADYGATLAFDDAENISDPNRPTPINAPCSWPATGVDQVCHSKNQMDQASGNCVM
jgi:hypothetical protein